MKTSRRRPLTFQPRIALAACVLVALLAGAAVAAAYPMAEKDFLAHDTGGQAVYEDMAIRPQASYDETSTTTFVTYQGPGLDPYVVAFDHTAGSWKGPVKVAENSLDLSRDMHGAPAMAIDNAGYIHIFYGAHNSTVRHLRSKQPRSIESGWYYDASGAPNLVGKYSYPQPSLDADTGATHLFVRKDDFKEDYEWLSGWRIHTLASGASSWETTPTPVLRDSTTKRWYANAYRSAEGTTHVAAVGFNHWETWMKPPGSNSPFYSRQGLYYLEVSPDGELYTVDGVRIVDAIVAADTDPNPGSAEATMTLDYGADQAALETSTIVDATMIEDGYWPVVEYQNQVVVRVDPDTGEPGVLFLSGPHTDTTTFIATEDQYAWKFARWRSEEATWSVTEICRTDQFFDAGTFEFSEDGTITAYLTAEGYEPPVFHTTNRGGSIVRYDSDDGGSTWQKTRVLRTASPVNGTRYNDPQLVVNGTDEARLLFCEWDNAGVNFVRKVFLGDTENGATLTKQVAPRFDRIAGNDRVQTSIEIAKEGYPLGSNWVVLASASSFPDALAGVPLAFAHDAPVLLVPEEGLTQPLVEEIQRLKLSRGSTDYGVIVLGGSAAVTSTVEAQVKKALGWASSTTRVKRIDGVNRYDTAKNIAVELQKRRGGMKPTAAVIASGETFPDALAVSPLAAVRGWPILLTPSDSLSGYATGYIAGQGITTVHPVGGTAVVPAAADALPGAVRWWGSNRYTTAKRIADEAYGKGLYRERLVIASGETYPDALAGGMLAARQRATLGLVAPSLVDGGINPGLALLATDSAINGALRWYILGGERAVGPDVATYLSGYLEGAAP
ncbi:MAG: cell wall-binding repeat-containing protein [Anaerosomatales bacterium]|nr:cell wall-binding repeat-containing protein [Anaerosomatales bacterium]